MQGGYEVSNKILSIVIVEDDLKECELYKNIIPSDWIINLSHNTISTVGLTPLD